jgi:RNA polymerase sigma-70 factor (ECF subfamily)
MFLKISFKSKSGGDLQSLSDEQLIDAFKQQANNVYIGQLFERYTHLVFGVCLKYLKNVDDSKDAVMQVFEDLPAKINDHQISNFKSWLYSVAKNHCLMKLRKDRSSEKARLDLYENIRHEIMETPDVFHLNHAEDADKRISMLQAGITALKTEQRRCIELLYLQNKSYSEVANLTGYSLKKVKSYIQNGKRNLKLFMENE